MPLSVSRRDSLRVAARSHSAIYADGETGKHSCLRGSRPQKDLRVRSPLCVPCRKKPAAFRFRGLRKSRENCISAGSLLLFPIEPRFDGDPVYRCGAIGRRTRFKIGIPVGSNPTICTTNVACSSVGRAPGCGPGGRRSESAHAPHTGP